MSEANGSNGHKNPGFERAAHELLEKYAVIARQARVDPKVREAAEKRIIGEFGTLLRQPMLATAPPEVERVGLGYRATFGNGIVMELTRVRESHGELSGELTVTNQESASVFDSHIMAARFNLSSLTTRKTMSTALTARLSNVDWSGLLERFCLGVLSESRKGGELVRVGWGEIGGLKKVDDEVRWLLKPILLAGKSTILFGAGGSYKSTLATAAAVQCATGAEVVPGWACREQQNVLVLDWEDDAREWDRRVRWLAVGAGAVPPGLHYRSMTRQLDDELEAVSKIVAEENIGVVIVDSVGLAIGATGEHESYADGAFRLFNALRFLGTTNLLIDHVAGADLENAKTAKPFGCYSADTEVLTERGWLTHDRLDPTDRVAAFDDGELRWETPTAFHAYSYTGPMHRYSSHRTECFVTPNHRMLVQPGWKHQLGKVRENRTLGDRTRRFIESSSLNTADWKVAIGADVQRTDVSEDLLDLARLLGWWIAEGSLQGSTGIRMGQCPGVLESRITDTLDRLGLKYWRKVYDRPGRQAMAHIVAWALPDANEWLREEAGHNAGTKRLPETVFAWPVAMQEALLEALVDGDGQRLPSGVAIYSTISKELADDVQRLALVIGRTARLRAVESTYRDQPYRSYQVSILQQKETWLRVDRNRTVEPYNGMVYCLTVPSGAYITRINGKPAIQGNSVFKVNLARLTFFVQASKEVEGETAEVVIKQSKTNTVRVKDQELAITHNLDNAQIVIKGTRVHSSDLAGAIPLRDRIARLLGENGALTKREIAERLEAKVNSITQVIKRYPQQFTLLADDRVGLKLHVVSEGKAEEGVDPHA